MFVFWSMHLWPQCPPLAADVAGVFENLQYSKTNYGDQLQTFTIVFKQYNQIYTDYLLIIYRFDRVEKSIISA